MNRSLTIAAAVLTLAAIAAASTSYPPKVQKTLYAEKDLRGKHAPKLTVEKWLIGAAPNTKGKIVFVDFWATWCPPCRELIPEINDWKKQFGNRIVFIGISDEKPEVVSDFMKTTPMEYNVGVDTKGTTAKSIGVQGIPHVMVITPDGVVRWQGFPGEPSDQLTAAKLQQIVDAYRDSK